MTENLATLPMPEALLQNNVTLDEKTCLPDLLDETSWLIFSCLLPHPAQLSLPAAEWGEEPAYREGKGVIEGIKVTNDVAERGMKLFQDFASSVPAQEKQSLHVVKRHRKEVTDFSKSSL